MALPRLSDLVIEIEDRGPQWKAELGVFENIQAERHQSAHFDAVLLLSNKGRKDLKTFPKRPAVFFSEGPPQMLLLDHKQHFWGAAREGGVHRLAPPGLR